MKATGNVAVFGTEPAKTQMIQFKSIGMLAKAKQPTHMCMAAETCDTTYQAKVYNSILTMLSTKTVSRHRSLEELAASTFKAWKSKLSGRPVACACSEPHRELSIKKMFPSSHRKIMRQHF